MAVIVAPSGLGVACAVDLLDRRALIEAQTLSRKRNPHFTELGAWEREDQADELAERLHGRCPELGQWR
jgi:hypothetical protein